MTNTNSCVLLYIGSNSPIENVSEIIVLELIIVCGAMCIPLRLQCDLS